jgi:DNA topoisomerase-3
MAYICENSVGPERRCDFRSGRIILQRPMEREQIEKMLATGKTDLLHRFISRKGRPFSAFLVRGPDGVRFEFAPRAGKPKAQPPAEKPVRAKAAKAPAKRETKGKTARGKAAKAKRAA